MNLYPVTIISDFYDNPDSIRNYALSQKYTYCHEQKNIEYVYPGGRSKELKDLSQSLYEKVCKKLISIFHISDYDQLRLKINTSFQIVEEKYGHGLIHQDQNTVFAGVIYLTPNAPLNSGTSLFQKNNKYNEERYWELVKKNDELFKRNDPIDYSHHDMFDEIVKINNIYNTLIIFEGNIHHCANNFFGTTPLDSRLTQVFFITQVDATKQSSFPILRIKNHPI